MRIPSHGRTIGAIALGLSAAVLFSPSARAADTAQTQYQADVERCRATPGIDKEACLREAGAALQAARRGKLTTPGAQSAAANRTARCDALPASERQDCMTLMERGNTVTQGSVSGGGVIRETTITIPAPATTMPGSTMPAPTGAPATSTMPAPATNVPATGSTMN